MSPEFEKQLAEAPYMTTVFLLREGEWQAMWHGKPAHATFNSKGAAAAWIASCDAAGRWRA